MKLTYCLFIVFVFAFSTIFAQKTIIGKASFYHNKFNGRKCANGEIFSNKKMTCASNSLKLGTIVKVTNMKNNKSVIVKVTDRLAANNHRVVDLTYAAAKKLDFINSGLVKVKVEVVHKNKDTDETDAKDEIVEEKEK
jgi:rare lipoprotein A